MADKKVMLTEDGYNKLVDKVNYLKSVRRIEIAERLKAAIALGDLSENSEYDDAKMNRLFWREKFRSSKQRFVIPTSSRQAVAMSFRWGRRLLSLILSLRKTDRKPS